MSARSEIERRIARKRADLDQLRTRIREGEIYIAALEDTLKLLPRDGVNEGDAETILRPNSIVAKARQVLLGHREPLHVRHILERVGRTDTRGNRSALAGSIGAYVRKGEIFYRVAPNTFGLLELKNRQAEDNGFEGEEPPPDFGDEPEPTEPVRLTDDDVPF